MGSFTQISPKCFLAASTYLLPAGIAAYFFLLSSGVSFLTFLFGFIVSILLIFKVYVAKLQKMRVKQNLIHFIIAERQQHYKYLLLMLGKRIIIGEED